MKDINTMTGREVSDYIIKHMERGEKMMLAGREDSEFAYGFKLAVIGMKSGLDILAGASHTEAFLRAVPKIVDAHDAKA